MTAHMINIIKTKKRRIILSIGVLFIIAVSIIGASSYSNKEEVKEEEIIRTFSVIDLSSFIPKEDEIESIGIVNPNTSVNIVPLTKGTVISINFAQSDYVAKNNIILKLQNDSITQSLETAKINLKSTQDNLNNRIILQEKSSIDQKKQAVISTKGYLNLILKTLNDINFIIKAEGESQIAGISPTLSAQNSQGLIDAKKSYFNTKTLYQKSVLNDIEINNIINILEQSLISLKSTEKALDDLIFVLENTIPNPNFSKTTLQAQKTLFNTARISLLATETQAETQLQNLKNIEIIQKTELDTLTNALNFAQNQMDLSQIAFNNLTIKAPIAGQITQKLVEIGDEINPGQKIAEISQINIVKIETSLTPDEIKNLRLGQNVSIEHSFNGIVSSISPIADFESKKIKVSITTNNILKNLIPGTFVTISFPVKRTKQKLIPLKALHITQKDTFIFILEEGRAIKKSVVIGETKGSYITIKEGLSMDEILILGDVTENETINPSYGD